MITRPRGTLEGGMPSVKLLESCLKEQTENRARLNRLRDYYDGHHEIQRRDRSAGLPNVRMIHAFPRYISTMAAGYLIGSPVEYSCESQTDALGAVLRE